MKDPTGTPDSTESAGAEDSRATESRRGPTWRGWILSILVAILLSVTATLFLGGYEAFRPDCATGPGEGPGGSGAGSGNCPHSNAGK